jgi:hypothetical protein
MNELKIKPEEIKIGSIVKTWNDNIVEVLEILTDPKMKPLIVKNGEKTQYYHFNQIIEIL